MWAISVQPPFSWAIIHAGKDVENRSWQPKGLKQGERLAIVASKTWHPNFHQGKGVNMKTMAFYFRLMNVSLPPTDKFLLGGLIGTVIFQGVSQDSPSQWAESGLYHWLLSDPQPLEFRPIKGQLGIYKIDI